MASYQPVTQEFLAQLESIVPGRVTAGSEVNPDYGRDEMPIYGVHPPEAAVEILSTEEAAAVVKLCYAHNIPVTTRGAGTGLVGGCVPVFGGVVLSTACMNRILGYDLENFTVTVQPGFCSSNGGGRSVPRMSLSPRSRRKAGHTGRQCLHQCQRDARGEVRGHPGLRQGHDRGAAHRRGHSVWLRRLQNQLGLQPAPPDDRFGGHPGHHHRADLKADPRAGGHHQLGGAFRGPAHLHFHRAQTAPQPSESPGH